MKKIITPILLLLAIPMMSACVPYAVKAQPAATQDSSSIVDSVVATVEAGYAQQTAMAPTATASPTPTAVPTATPTQTAQPFPTFTPMVTLTASPTPQPCDQAQFVSDVTIPNGTHIPAGSTFTKTWRLRNTGTCTWTPDYKILFISGNALNGPTMINMPGYVNPGELIDISVNLTAPEASGTYEGYYKIENPSGQIFGVGQTGIYSFDYQVVVGSTPAPFAVRHVIMSVDTSVITITCPPGHTFTFTAVIGTNGPGVVQYHWEFSDGSQTGVQSLTFSGAGYQPVSTTWALGTNAAVSPNPFSGWARIYIDEPNHQAFSEQPVVLSCAQP